MRHDPSTRLGRGAALLAALLGAVAGTGTAAEPALADVRIARAHRVNSGFYLSQAFELRRAP